MVITRPSSQSGGVQVEYRSTALSGLFNAVLLGLLARGPRAPAPRPAA